jgi:SEC-C motif domain protein
MNNLSTSCACQSQRDYSECCGHYLSNQDIPKTPEALMRSRYTAYSQANIDYIQRTMRGQALINFNPEEARQWAMRVQWLGLKIISAPMVTAATHIGFVEFIAIFMQDNQRHIIHERSEFHRLDGRWYYMTGYTPKVNRNATCPCGSGKKFKRCCSP